MQNSGKNNNNNTDLTRNRDVIQSATVGVIGGSGCDGSGPAQAEGVGVGAGRVLDAAVALLGADAHGVAVEKCKKINKIVLSYEAVMPDGLDHCPCLLYF